MDIDKKQVSDVVTGILLSLSKDRPSGVVAGLRPGHRPRRGRTL